MNELHRRAGDLYDAVLRQAGPDVWERPTPCAEWDVRDLVHHAAWSNLWVAPLVRGESLADVGPRLEGDVLGDDPVGVGLRSTAEASGAFDEPGAMDRLVELSRGPTPGREYCGERMNDLTVHAWDLAAALGLPIELDAGCMEAAMEVYRPMEAAGRPAGMFGPVVEVPPDADLQTRFLAFWGRRSDWAPPA
jgi:uncharacterized protein (TIGR03086 family)